MQHQFEFYTNPNVPLLAFGGDVTINPKWKAACRLLDRWLELQIPVVVLYYGDLDDKGLEIPESARRDIVRFVGLAMQTEHNMPYDDTLQKKYQEFQESFRFIRVGLNDEVIASGLIARSNLDPSLIEPHLGQHQVSQYNIPENPDRPGTYQWEGLDDVSAQDLIGQVDQYLNEHAFDQVVEAEERVTVQFKAHLQTLEVEE